MMSVMQVIGRVNRLVADLIRFVCVALLVLMTGFVVYTIIMRYVFHNPPFWGDTLAIFANIWLVLMAFALAVYDRDHIAMQGMYDRLSPRIAMFLRLVWDFVILAMGLFMLVYGMVLFDNIRGSYHELAGLQKKWPVMILPLFGLMTVFAVLTPIVSDFRALMKPRSGKDQARKGD
jgi:TRAP-type C4-dicarboxylate transport system permease small subunit